MGMDMDRKLELSAPWFIGAIKFPCILLVVSHTQCWCLPPLSSTMQYLVDLGLIKSVVGAAAGGAIGMILFRSGGGWRAASAAAGVGVAWGSTYERAVAIKK